MFAFIIVSIAAYLLLHFLFVYTDHLNKLFNTVFEIGRTVQRANLPNGKEIWGEIQNIVGIDTKYLGRYDSMPLYKLNNDIKRLDGRLGLSKEEFTNINNHYLLQLSNIPFVKSDGYIYIYRLLQIAFNAGNLYELFVNGKLDVRISDILNNLDFISVGFYLNYSQWCKINAALNRDKVVAISSLYKKLIG